MHLHTWPPLDGTGKRSNWLIILKRPLQPTQKCRKHSGKKIERWGGTRGKGMGEHEIRTYLLQIRKQISRLQIRIMYIEQNAHSIHCFTTEGDISSGAVRFRL